MLALRYAALLALGLWVGGLAALGGVAAPATFDAVAARGIEDGRLVAGAVFGETLRRFHYVCYACGALLIASLVLRAILGPRPRRFAVRLGLAVVMLLAVGWSGFVVTPAIAAMQQEIGVAPSSLPESDPRRQAFGRQHGLSTALLTLPIVGGLFLMFFELRD
jgi:Domain of unknown function (DUF4149)